MIPEISSSANAPSGNVGKVDTSGSGGQTTRLKAIGGSFGAIVRSVPSSFCNGMPACA